MIKPMREVSVINRTRGRVVGERIECAETSWARMRGLLGRSGICEGGGLWIKPSSGVHTLGMKFAIDVVGLDRKMRVVKLWPRCVPFRVTTVSLGVSSVLELRSGSIATRGIHLGDQMECRPIACSAGRNGVGLAAE